MPPRGRPTLVVLSLVASSSVASFVLFCLSSCDAAACRWSLVLAASFAFRRNSVLLAAYPGPSSLSSSPRARTTFLTPAPTSPGASLEFVVKFSRGKNSLEVSQMCKSRKVQVQSRPPLRLKLPFAHHPLRRHVKRCAEPDQTEGAHAPPPTHRPPPPPARAAPPQPPTIRTAATAAAPKQLAEYRAAYTATATAAAHSAPPRDRPGWA